MTTRTEPTLLDALALLARVADELVVDTARDTHLAWVDRVHGLLDRQLGPSSAIPASATAPSPARSTPEWGSR